MRVDEGIVFANFSDESLSEFARGCQESFRDVKYFLFDSARRVDIEGAWMHDQEEFLVVGLRCRKSNHLEHCVQHAIDFVAEAS